jgi:hypothetical protein
MFKKVLTMASAIVLSVGFFVSCSSTATNFGSSSSSSSSSGSGISVNDPNALAGAFVVNNATTVTGSLPAPSGNVSTAPTINSASPASVETTTGVKTQVPVYFTSPTGITCLYVQIQGANKYWSIPLSGGATSGYVCFYFTLPANVSQGTFVCVLGLQNDAYVSTYWNTTITLAPIVTCSGSYSKSGSDGLTATSYNMGAASGTIHIDYDTYSVPDRIDVFMDGQWVDGTGSDLGTSLPPIKQCSEVVSGDGFLGQVGTFDISYPGNKTVTVYVSGCMGSGTAWDYTIFCPQ